MWKPFVLLLLFTSSYHQICAQVFPKEGSSLCYRLIGFSFPAGASVTQYKLEIATGSYSNAADFEKNIVKSVSCKKSKVITEVPYFGCQYTWRVIPAGSKAVVTKDVLHHFSVKITQDVDSASTRLRIISPAEKYKDAYVFIDGARALYDMNGKPVWFLPGTELKVNQKAYPRDLKPTPQGTITFLTNGDAYEITYGGNIVWRTQVTNQSVKHFHHEFTRLRNGYYMGMLSELSDNNYLKLLSFKDSIAHNANDSARFYRRAWINSLVEYDPKGNLVWRWDGYNYLMKSDLIGEQKADSSFDLNDLHENAFFFDEINKVVYVSFRNINRVIKIKYPEGTILNTYGAKYAPGVQDMHNELFCGQHSCRKSQKGYLYLFNNNVCNASHIPTIVMLQEPPEGKSELKKIWEYQCTVENPEVMTVENSNFLSGGNVVELPDQSIFVSMGSPYCKVFIVGTDKKVLWSAISEKYNSGKERWELFSQLNVYRASMISRKDLEELIWNSEKYE